MSKSSKVSQNQHSGKEYRKNVALILERRSGKILICQRSDCENSWQFPQGGVDEGEKHEEALKREVKEELGWCPQKLEYLIKIMNKTVNCNITHYLAKCNISRDKLCLGEGATLGWFTYDEVLKLENKPNEVDYVTTLAKNRIQNS